MVGLLQDLRLDTIGSAVKPLPRPRFEGWREWRCAARSSRLWVKLRNGDVIICSCNVLSDHDVRSACETVTAPRSTGQVYDCLGCTPQCGRCARTIRQIIDQTLKGKSCADGCVPAHAVPDRTTGRLPPRR
jgi:bacterioferritin-associated ferredoxin